jgi:hypothetical protein
MHNAARKFSNGVYLACGTSVVSDRSSTRLAGGRPFQKVRSAGYTSGSTEREPP